MRLFAGLGNPGSNYAMNRHNVGFLAVDRLADRHGCSPWKKKGPSLISDGRIGSEKIILVKPQSFMNKSGLPIAEIARFHKIDANDIFVFHDELDLATGKLRVKPVAAMAVTMGFVISTGISVLIIGASELALAAPRMRRWMSNHGF